MGAAVVSGIRPKKFLFFDGAGGITAPSQYQLKTFFFPGSCNRGFLQRSASAVITVPSGHRRTIQFDSIGRAAFSS